MSFLQISSNVQKMKERESSALVRQTNKIQNELRQGAVKPYKEVINACWVDPHMAGVKPLSFVRQVLAACLYPQLLEGDKLLVDVKQRAQRLLKTCFGGSVGSYTSTAGIPEIVQRVSEFIQKRDGGVPSYPENIYISPGSQWSLAKILNILVNPEASPRTGILTPVPCHITTVLSITGMGAVAIPYHLNEEQGWTLQVEELQRALEAAKGLCNPVALYVINPGNPAGHVQSRKSMEEVIHFISEKKLFLLADEVYQDCVYGENVEFVSYKRVLAKLGPPLSDTVELASFHSASKGFMGECGLRAGYVELVNVDPAVMKYICTFFSTDSCAPVLGQIALEVMVNPPQPGDPSYLVYKKTFCPPSEGLHRYEETPNKTDSPPTAYSKEEKKQLRWCKAGLWSTPCTPVPALFLIDSHVKLETQHIKTTLKQNARRILEVINSLQDFSCQPVEGAFAFPRIYLPPKAIQRAKEVGMQPDTYYCTRLLEDAGVLISPGCEFGQKEGTYHIRLFIMTPQDIMVELLKRLSTFHVKFIKEFSY